MKYYISASCLRPIRTTFFLRSTIFGKGVEGSTLEHRTKRAGQSSVIALQCTLKFISTNAPFVFMVTQNLLMNIPIALIFVLFSLTQPTVGGNYLN
jgi:hypothetical protein